MLTADRACAHPVDLSGDDNGSDGGGAGSVYVHKYSDGRAMKSARTTKPTVRQLTRKKINL